MARHVAADRVVEAPANQAGTTTAPCGTPCSSSRCCPSRRRNRWRDASGAERQALCGILFVLHTGIQWEYLPQELGFGSG
ncbi:hypothetical protein [Streptomyces flaveolus]|uniref:hypothetical protein n=1 Tax=Streptomyces flaveolus TaxID=67297 RepID=UPI003683BDB3